MNPKKIEVLIATDTGGAKVNIDGESVGETPLSESVSALPGLHKLSIIKNGFETIETQIEVKPNTINSFHFTLIPTRPVSDVESTQYSESKSDTAKNDTENRTEVTTNRTAHQTSNRKKASKIVMWTGTAVAVALGITSGAFFILAETSSAAFDEARNEYEEVNHQIGEDPYDLYMRDKQGELYEEMSTHREKAERFGHLGIGFAASAATAATAALATFIVTRARGERPKTALSFSPGGLAVSF